MENLENIAVTEQTAASAPAEQVEQTTSTSPAEVDNTVKDVDSKTIPYSRFKEINDKMNEYKTVAEQFKEFKGYDSTTLKALVDFNQMLNDNPTLAEQVQKVIEGYGKQPQVETEQDLDPVQSQIKELQDKIKMMDNQVTKGLVEKNVQQYEKVFNELSSKDFKTESEKRLALHFTGLALDLKDNKWSYKYNDALIKDAYKEASELVNKYKKEILDEYTKAKDSISAPITNPGVNATQEVNMLDDKARREFVVNQLNELVKTQNKLI